jgi:hypothetical protein
MPEEYNVFVDEEAAQQAWESNKKKWTTHLLTKYAKTAAKTTTKSVVNHFTFSVAGAIFDAPAAISTSTHIERLGAIQINETTYPCKCGESATKCADVLKYVIEQKEKKKTRRIVGAIPVIGTLESLRGIYRSLTKTNKGGERELMAKVLRNNARNGCPKARATAADLVGNYKKRESWEQMFSVCDWEEGWKVLKEKMAST